MCKNLKEFRDAIWPTEVRFAAHMQRKDLHTEIISKNNMFCRNQSGFVLKSAKFVRREDFSDFKPFDFDPLGEGYRHMAVLVLSVVKEFCNNC